MGSRHHQEGLFGTLGPQRLEDGVQEQVVDLVRIPAIADTGSDAGLKG